MPTIQKISLASLLYYLELVVQDYYLSGGEPPGQWSRGQGPAALGLVGTVDHAQFRDLFMGFSPDGEKEWVQNAGQKDGYHKRCPGWDLTFSPPKSISVLWSQSSEETRTKIQLAHRRAIESALEILEGLAAITRRGAGGKIWEEASFVVALFEHGTSRAQEPQLHSHALLLNLTARRDGTTGAVRSQGLYDLAHAIGALYRCELATILEWEMGITSHKVETWFELNGVDPKIAEVFSSRRKEILEYCKKAGRYDAFIAQVANIETRQVKGHVARALLFPQWQEIGDQLGWSEARFAEQSRAHLTERNAAEELDRLAKFVAESFSDRSRRPAMSEVLEAAARRGCRARA